MEDFALSVVYDRDSVWQSFDKKTADFLLHRNWFYHNQDIVDVLNSADEDAWAYIYKNRSKYSLRIRQIIEPNDYKIHSTKPVVELTDRMIFMMEKERKDKCMDDWIQELKNVPPRPHDDIDTQLEQADHAFEHANDLLANYLEKQTKKYKSPLGRLLVDPKQKALEDTLAKVKNERDNVKDRVVNATISYLETKRRDFEAQWVFKL